MQSQHDRITTTIKRQWLAEIIAGRKKIEYRQIKPHWTRRLKSVTVPFELRLINGMKPRGSAESRSARCPIPAEALSLPAHDCVRVDDDQCSRHKGFARADGLLHRAQRQPVFLVLQHQRRKVLHFGVTEHPTAEWAAQQIVEAFANRDAKRYLIRDRDASYGSEFRRRIQSLGMKRGHHRATEPSAERVRGAADWLHST